MYRPTSWTDLLHTPTSSEGACHVSPGPSLDSDGARQMTVTSGRMLFPLLNDSDRLGFLSRTLLGSFRWRSTSSGLTWRAEGTPTYGRMYFRLAPSARRIAASGSSLWLTPNASDESGGKSVQPGSGNTRLSPKGIKQQYSLKQQAKDQARLSEETLSWPTPAAQEPGWRHLTPVTASGETPTHGNQRWYDQASGRILQKGLEQVASLAASLESELGLEDVDAENMWCTPPMVAGDATKGGQQPSTAKGTTLRAKVPGALNPAWVSQLMGFPENYTKLSPYSEVMTPTTKGKKGRKKKSLITWIEIN